LGLLTNPLCAAIFHVLGFLALQFVFMDQDTYEETRLGRDDWAKFLKEGAICSLLFCSGKVRAQPHLYTVCQHAGCK
jgi:hypothetical protein